MTTKCATCPGPAAGGYICRVCARRLRDDLHQVPDLLTELETTRARLNRHGAGISTVIRANSTPLPWAEHASSAISQLRGVLVTEADRYDLYKPSRPVSSDRAELHAQLLAQHVDTIRHQTTAEATFHTIRAAVRRARYVIDAPAEKWYAGPCECGTDLYARIGADTIICPDCHARYDAEARGRWLLEQVQHYVLTPAEMARALTALLDQRVHPRTIGRWIQHGRLAVHGYLHHDEVVAQRIDRADSALVRVGDVVELVMHLREEQAG